MKINTYALDLALAKATLTRRELAQRANISESLLSKACNGHSGISPRVAGRISKALDTPVEYLVEPPNNRGVSECK